MSETSQQNKITFFPTAEDRQWVKDQAQRLDRPMGWVIKRALLVARRNIESMPSAEPPIGGA